MNDISEIPSWSPLSCPAPLSHSSITVPLIIYPTLVSPQESVLSRYYRHECSIAIVRPVRMDRIKSMDNSQGKCARYKIKPRPFAHWSNDITAWSHVMDQCVRRRIAAAPNDNSEGKSSRFKDLALVRVRPSSTQVLEYTIACIPPLPSPLINDPRNEITMTPPMSPGIQCPCFLPIDPPCTTESNLPSQPSTSANLPLTTFLPPPLRLSTLPPSNEIQLLSPSNKIQLLSPSNEIQLLLPSNEIQLLPPGNVTFPPPPYNDPLPLPTMLINSSVIPLPPSSSAILLSLPLPHITRHRMSESIGLEAHHFPQLLECAQSICRQWPSGATVACLSREWCDVIVHASRGQHALEYLRRTGSTGRLLNKPYQCLLLCHVPNCNLPSSTLHRYQSNSKEGSSLQHQCPLNYRPFQSECAPPRFHLTGII